MKKSRLGESQRPIYEASNARWSKLQELAAWLKILAGHELLSAFRADREVTDAPVRFSKLSPSGSRLVRVPGFARKENPKADLKISVS
jgi:hypothetical protein